MYIYITASKTRWEHIFTLLPVKQDVHKAKSISLRQTYELLPHPHRYTQRSYTYLASFSMHVCPADTEMPRALLYALALAFLYALADIHKFSSSFMKFGLWSKHK